MASACSPTLADLRPFSSSVSAAWDSDSELETDIARLSPIEEFMDHRVIYLLNFVTAFTLKVTIYSLFIYKHETLTELKMKR